MDADKRITLLSCRLPQQRRQLVQQSRRLGLAVSDKASSPVGLAVAMVSGAILAWCWCRADTADHTGSVPFVRDWHSAARALLMVCLGRSVV
ncbi:hypothetical protein ABGI61_01890 [Rheinheimera sp. FR7-31]|uniref:hypothetical protein n=1 Tax=Rheinheimera fenheensis TaxID=3152295 RepID=UPI00325EFA08